jgi:hypothetical protein
MKRNKNLGKGNKRRAKKTGEMKGLGKKCWRGNDEVFVRRGSENVEFDVLRENFFFKI